MGRVASVAEEIRFALECEEKTSELHLKRMSGELPLRVTHNNTNINNVLMDECTRNGLCVIDLDTVMPGFTAYDYGDSIRSGAATEAEDLAR